MSGLLDDLAIWNRRGGVMVTVVEALGSTPREPGAYMIVDGDGRLAHGTIGGGALELEATRRAQAVLDGVEPALLLDAPLGPELGQCCGGHVTLLFERLPIAVEGLAGSAEPMVVTELGTPIRRSIVDSDLAPRGGIGLASRGRPARVEGRRVLVQPGRRLLQPVALFGAGHVGRAVVRALSPLPFAIRWIDDRRDQFPADAAAMADIVLTSAPADQVAALVRGSFAVIMTHSHGLDFEILRRALAREDLRYVGLIGSATKRARFSKRLRAYGVGEAAIGRLSCPIGLPNVIGKDPAVIAASVAADLLIRMEQAKLAHQPAALRVVS